MGYSNQYYESYKETPVVIKPVTKVSTVKRAKKPLKVRFSKLVKRFEGKKLTKTERAALQEQQKRVILGIGLLLVVVSITFSTFVTLTFVDDKAIYLALAPQVAFALVSLFKAFSKIYK